DAVNALFAQFSVDPQSVNQKVFDSLIKSGACDVFGGHRAALAGSVAGLTDQAQKRRREIEAGQSNLFGSSATALPAEALSSVPQWAESERLRLEKEALGFYLSGNPLIEFESHLARLVTHTTEQLRGGFQGTATVGGLVTRISRNKIKSGPNAGRVMARFVIEDLTGSLPVTLFADMLQRYDSMLQEDAAVIVKGQVRERGAEVEMTIEEMTLLARAVERLVSGLRVSLDRELPQTEMLRLRDLLTDHPGDAAVEFEVRLGEELVLISPLQRFKVNATPALLSRIEGIVGAGKVHRLGL
ncbi:MAG: OB-fold nucleic acid binding domain-containing protein, partial [Thermoanaerobaculia bacterium]